MGSLGGIVGGAVGGVIGAAVWAAIVYFTGYEVGYVAWGVGLLAGFGTVMGAGGNMSTSGPLAAAGITVLSLVAGKYAAVHFIVEQELESMTSDDDELVVSYVADEVLAEWTQDGRPWAWPPGADSQNPVRQSDYPPDAWAEARSRWLSLTPDERDRFRAEVEALVQEVADYARSEGFGQSFAAMDVLFFLLAVGTAFKVAQGQLE